MKRWLLAALLLTAWTVEAQPVYKYWVEFTDKRGTPFRLDAPEEYLGPRALERRARQRIQLDSMDLPVNPAYVEALQQEGLTVLHSSKWFNGVIAYSADSLADDREWPDFVRGVRLCEVSPLSVPDTDVPNLGYSLPVFDYDTLYGADYYGGGFAQISQLNGQMLHRCGYEGKGVLIGVCDCGFPGVDTAAIFDSMRAEGRLVATRDFVWPMEDNVFNMHSHGTHALSTMAVLVPGMYVGTAPKASYVLCRTENVLLETLLEEYNWTVAAEWLDSLGADIISTSLGYFFFDDSTQSHSLEDLDGRTAPMSRAAGIAVSRGMLVVNSAGNDGWSEPQHLNVPADVPQVLTVGAVDSAGVRADFSSFGPTATLCIKPDVMAMGVNVISASPDGLFRYTNGTSLSCPVMAGMMACLRQRFPQLTPGQLCDSVRSWGSLAAFPDHFSGYGIPDFSHAVSGMPVGIGNGEGQGEPFLLYPNPARREAMVVLQSAGRVEVYDLKGGRVFFREVDNMTGQVKLPLLPAGVYLVRVSTARGIECRKLVVD